MTYEIRAAMKARILAIINRIARSKGPHPSLKNPRRRDDSIGRDLLVGVACTVVSVFLTYQCTSVDRAKTDAIETGRTIGQNEILISDRENLIAAKEAAEKEREEAKEQRDKALAAARALNRVEALFGKDWELAARERVVLNSAPKPFAYRSCRSGPCIDVRFTLILGPQNQPFLRIGGSFDASNPVEGPYLNVVTRIPIFMSPMPARVGCFTSYHTPHVKVRFLIEDADVGSILLGVAAKAIPPPNDSGEAKHDWVCPPEAHPEAKTTSP